MEPPQVADEPVGAVYVGRSEGAGFEGVSVVQSGRASSGCRAPQLQIMMVASPRNHKLIQKPANYSAGFFTYAGLRASGPQPSVFGRSGSDIS